MHYFRDTDKREADFIIVKNNKPIKAIECKLKVKVKDISPHLKYFKTKFPDTGCIQVHLECKNEYISKEDIKFVNWLSLLKDLI